MSYLWRVGPQEDLLRCMLEDQVEAVLVKTAAPGLVPRKHLQQSLGRLYYGGVFTALQRRFRFQLCGEGGEYETLVLDCPLFHKRLVLDETEIVFPDGTYDDTDDYDGTVGLLNILSFHVEDKSEGEIKNNLDMLLKKTAILSLPERISQHNKITKDDSYHSSHTADNHDTTSIPSTASSNDVTTAPPSSSYSFLPHAKSLPGGLVHFSELRSTSPTPSSSSSSPFPPSTKEEAAVQQLLDILSTLREALRRRGLTPCDVVYVHLYLSDMAHFAALNGHYLAFFGSHLPPGRSCVGVGDNDGIALDVLAQRPTGARDTLHVQSRSYWAPVCVGPYSQANTLRGGLTVLSGQIGLEPATMAFDTSSSSSCGGGCWRGQLRRCWSNAASVLDAVGGANNNNNGELRDCLGALVYLSGGGSGANGTPPTHNHATIAEEARTICREALTRNGGIVVGHVDEANKKKDELLFGGYEDEDTYLEMTQQNKDNHHHHHDRPKNNNTTHDIPVMVVFIPQMPVGALAEVELVCGTNKATSSIGIETVVLPVSSSCHEDETDGNDQAGVRWDCGYDNQGCSGTDEHVTVSGIDTASIEVGGEVRFMKSCCAMAWITATSCGSGRRPLLRQQEVNGRSTLPPPPLLDLEDVMSAMVSKIIAAADVAGMHRDHVLHIRLYYVVVGCRDHGSVVRTALAAEIGRQFARRRRPASTVVPVQALERDNTVFAAQVMINDLVHTETEMWVRHGRDAE